MAQQNLQIHNQKITTCLWFNDNAEEAVNLYTSVFNNSSIGTVTRYGEAGPGPEGSVLTIDFQLENQPFMALNGGPEYKFTPAISFVVNCETQEEVDRFWNKLSDGGREDQCGWLTDRFGVSWQIVPTALIEMMQDKDAKKVRNVTEAMFKMKKLDIATLREAYQSK